MEEITHSLIVPTLHYHTSPDDAGNDASFTIVAISKTDMVSWCPNLAPPSTNSNRSGQSLLIIYARVSQRSLHEFGVVTGLNREKERRRSHLEWPGG
jgi:hypothetical protein